MASEPVGDHDREPGMEAHVADLAAEIDRLWEEQRDDADQSAGDDGSGDDERDADATPATVIDAVVEPPSGATQSAVEEAVTEAESADGLSRETDGDDQLSM